MTDNEELDIRLNPPPFRYDRHFVMVDPERWNAVARENQELREAVEKLQAINAAATQLRSEIVSGGESPPEQYELLDTITLLRTRWMPVRDHLVEVRQLEAEVQRLRDELAREKCASRVRVSRFADVDNCMKRDL